MMVKQIIPSIAHELCCENIDQAVIKGGAEKSFLFFFHFFRGLSWRTTSWKLA